DCDEYAGERRRTVVFPDLPRIAGARRARRGREPRDRAAHRAALDGARPAARDGRGARPEGAPGRPARDLSSGLSPLAAQVGGGPRRRSAGDAMSAAAPAGALRAARVALAGNPNSGKSTLFNALSGSNVRVGNYPGVTVDRRSARATLAGAEVELVDLPGTYALTAGSPEEQVAVDLLLNPNEAGPDAIIAVVDATTLSRGLYLT